MICGQKYKGLALRKVLPGGEQIWWRGKGDKWDKWDLLLSHSNISQHLHHVVLHLQLNEQTPN
jgi:hypothetical protein